MSTQDKKTTDDRDDVSETPEVVEGPHASRADVAPEMSQLQNQPHGQAGQPQNRPAHEGHQGITPIQPDSQVQGDESVVGESPQQAFTHSDPPEVVDTAYTGRAHEHSPDGEHGHGEPERGHSGQSTQHRGSDR